MADYERVKSPRFVLTKAFILFAISVATVILAFASGATAIGMVFIMVSIVCLGSGAGCIMNTPCPTSGENSCDLNRK
jgi:hypothetical protein